MAKTNGRNGGGAIFTNPRNETTGGAGPEDPDLSGGGIYGDWNDDVLKMHLSQDGTDLLESPNIQVGSGIAGGPAPGEPNPASFSGTSQSFEGSGKK